MKFILTFIILIAGFQISNAQQYKPVAEKSDIKFTIKNFGINTTGAITGLKGTIKFDANNIAASSFNVSVEANTINTGNNMRDDHLKKEDYFNVAKYPAISFVSTVISGNKDQYTVTGNLTIKGVTKSVSFPFTTKSDASNLIFSGSFEINRKDFGVGGSSAVLGNSVTVDLKVVAVKA